MSHKKRKGKAYRPRHELLNTLGLLMPSPRPQATMLLSRLHVALAMIERDSHPGTEEWNDLADMVNTVETLAVEMHKLPMGVMPHVHAAAHGMAMCALRWRDGRGFRLDGPGMTAVRQVLGFYVDALGALTAQDMDNARLLTDKRVAQYRKGIKTERDVVSV